MTAPLGWLGLIAGEWTIHDDARSCARRAVRAARALDLRAVAVSTDERCLARLAADGWSLRPAASADPADLAAALRPPGSRVVPPALLLGDGPGLSETAARVAALLDSRVPDPGAVARCAEVVTRPAAADAGERAAPPARRYVAQAQDGDIVGVAEDVTVGGHGRDYDCPGSADARAARMLRAHARAALDATGLTHGPVAVSLRAGDQGVYVTDIAAGRIDACVASVIELATGHDPIVGAVHAAAAVVPARARYARAARRHSSLRRTDLRTTSAFPDAAWLGLPGVVSTRSAADGVVVTVADDHLSAVRAAESALSRLSGRVPSARAKSGGGR